MDTNTSLMFNRKTTGTVTVLLAIASYTAFARSSKVAPLPAEMAALKTCEVHGDDLQLGTAVILYGDRPILVNDPAAIRQFPRAYSHIFGGCVISPDSPHLQQVKFCPDCRQAEAKWLTNHHKRITSS